MAGSVRPNVLRVLGSRQGRTPSADAPLPALATCGIHGGWSTIRSLFYFWRVWTGNVARWFVDIYPCVKLPNNKSDRFRGKNKMQENSWIG